MACGDVRIGFIGGSVNGEKRVASVVATCYFHIITSTRVRLLARLIDHVFSKGLRHVPKVPAKRTLLTDELTNSLVPSVIGC